MSSNCSFHGKKPLLFGCPGDEAHQAPLYYLAFAGWQRLVDLPARAPFRGPGVPVPFLLGPSINKDYFCTTARRIFGFFSGFLLPNVLLGALTVFFTALAIRLVSSNPWTPVVGASIVAFLPKFVFLSSSVTNDNLVNLLGAVLTFVALRFVRIPAGGVWQRSGCSSDCC